MTEILVLGSVGREKIYSFENVSSLVFGGTAYYATEAILKTNASAPLLVSVLGYDLPPDSLIEKLSRPIPKSGLYQNLNLPSFFWEARYEDNFEESVTLTLENRVIDDFNPNWSLLRDEFPTIKYCYLAAFEPSTQISCCQHFSNSFIISETLDYWINQNRDGVLEVIKNSNGVILTEKEFHSLWRIAVPPYSSLDLVIDIIEEFKLDFLIITSADRGSQVFDLKESFFVPAVRCMTIDSTGAGNAYSAGLTAHLSKCGAYDRKHLADAAALGTALAALQVQDFSNNALRKAKSADIIALQREVRKSINWLIN